MWLDSTGRADLSTLSIGLGKRNGDAIPFLWRERNGSVSLNNTFSHDKDDDSWAWRMDYVQNGKPGPVARVRLTRQ
jgi:hypothetical protein